MLKYKSIYLSFYIKLLLLYLAQHLILEYFSPIAYQFQKNYILRDIDKQIYIYKNLLLKI